MSWRTVKIGDILTESKIETADPNPDRRITVRLNCKGVEKRPYEKGIEGGTKYYTRKAGQFIYGKQNLFKGAFGLVPEELDEFESSQDIPTFDIDKACLPEWLIYFLRQGDFFKSLETIATGTGSRRIQPAKLFEVEMPLPTLSEQRKTINRLHAVEQEFSKIDAELNQQQTYLQLLRQTILQEAVQGKLTPQLPTDEPAAALLQRIKAEKRAAIKEGKGKKGQELPPIAPDEVPFEPPAGWVWCRLGEVCALVTSGSRSWKDYYSNEGAIFIRSQNIKSGKLDLNEIAFVNLPPKAEGTRTAIKPNDVLITITGGNVGKCAMVEEESLGEAYVSQHIALIRLVHPSMAQFFSHILEAEAIGGGQLQKMIYGDKPGLSLAQIQQIIVSLPPLPEQHRIVAKVQALHQKLAQLEVQVQQSRSSAQALLQTVLKEAFNQEGKLYALNEAVSLAAEGATD